MTLSRDILKFMLDHAGTRYAASEVMTLAGHPEKTGSASALLLGLLQHGCIARSGEKWSYEWYVADNVQAKARAQAHLDKPAHGVRDRDAEFNGGSPKRRQRDETPRMHAFPPAPPVAHRAIYPPEPLQFSIDDDGDMQVVGKMTGTPYLLISKLDAVDLLAFARAAAPIIEGDAP